MGIVPIVLRSAVTTFSFKVGSTPASKHVSIGVVALPFRGPIAYNECKASWVLRSADGIVYASTKDLRSLGSHKYGRGQTVTVIVVGGGLLPTSGKVSTVSVFFAVDDGELVGPVHASCDSS